MLGRIDSVGPEWLDPIRVARRIITGFPDSQGDYLAAGVSGIELDILADPVLVGSMRIFLYGPGGAWSTLNPVMVPAGSGWGHFTFDLTAGELVSVPPGSSPQDLGPGTGVLTDTLASVQTFLLRHNTPPTPSPTGSHDDHVTGSLGFDNITAVPEPSIALLCGLAAGSLLLRYRPVRHGIR